MYTLDIESHTLFVCDNTLYNVLSVLSLDTYDVTTSGTEIYAEQ